MAEQQERPSREDMIKWYREEIELASLRAELAKLQRDAAVSEAERIQAIAVIGQFTNPPQEEEGESKPRKLKKEEVNAD